VKQVFAFLLGATVCGAAPSGLHAQDSTSASSGVYTLQQAARGGALYQSKCATCHRNDLSGGGTSPALAGPDFMSNWTGQPLAALFDRIHTSMPTDQPGSLTAQQVADLIAFLLRSNRYPAGQIELPAVSDRLKQILCDKAP
jgi:mono/diheme cytochrome c family protein